jgi:hypothetical protein
MRIFLSLVLCVVAAPLSAALTGTWQGTLTASIACEDSGTVQVNGPAMLWVFDFGASTPGAPENLVHGGGWVNGPTPNLETCQQGPTAKIPFFFAGEVDGSTFTVDLIFPGELFEVSGSQSGETLTLSGPGDLGGSMSLTVNRINMSPPDMSHSGEYSSGTFSVNIDYSQKCNNISVINLSGSAGGFVNHTGEVMIMNLDLTPFFFLLEDGMGGCDRFDIAEGLPLNIYATINGNSLSGIIQTLDEMKPFSGGVNGDVIQGTMPAPGGGLNFTIQRDAIPLPQITSFTANPANIQAGQSSTLSWNTHLADQVEIDHGLGAQALTGSVTVSPNVTTTYTLTAKNPGGQTQAQATVTVTTAEPAPRVALSALPRGMVQAAGLGGATDSFTMSNIGDAGATVNLSPSGDFFTIDPTSFTLAAGESRTVTITGLAKPAGTYEGTISATGNGVPANATLPVRMLSAAAPTGTIQPRATAAREEVSSNAGENAAGSVEFTNNGTATMVAMAVSDVVWIRPQTGVITIPPGQTVSVTYTIESALRPDGNSPLGAATGKISLVFITGSSTGPILSGGGPPTSTVSVTLVHVAKPAVGSGSPTPLAPGELAMFVSGLGNRANATGDLLLANRLTTPLTGLQLFLQGSGVPSSLSAAIPQLVPNSSVALPGLMKNVFNSAVQSGTAQLRGANVVNTSIAAIQSNTSSPAGTYSTALPVFRSDRSVTAAGTILLSGLQKGSGVQTDLFVQETSGTAGTFRVDFLDNGGTVVASRSSESITSFGFSELFDSAPASATAARITNTSGSARLSAYALVTNPATGDGWLVTDPSAGSTTETAFIVPIFSAGTAASTVLYTTNRSSAAASVTFDVHSTGTSRRRAVARAASTTPPLGVAEATTTTIAPSETRSIPITASSGYIRISGPAGAISAAGRSVRTSGTSTFGSGLPAVPVSAALTVGQSKRFAGVDDASTASRTASAPATFRTSLALVETNNQPANVRVTMQFAFSGGSSLVSSTARVTKDFTVAAGKQLLISDLGSEIIGASRESMGDLRNITLDVEVTGGTGRIIPFLQSTDNGSGDMIVRIE